MEIMINCSFYAIKIVIQCQDLLTGQNIFCHVGSGASNDMVVVNQPGYALFSMQVKNGQLVQKRSSLSL